MQPNRYDDLRGLTSNTEPSASGHRADAASGSVKSEPAQSAPSSTPTDNRFIPSKEHTTPITAFAAYAISIESDALVRIYDGVTVMREGSLLIERNELVGKTREEIQAHLSLSFVPRLLCDANVPIGHKMVMGKLTNAAGQKLSIFKGLTAINLSSERPLTPENIAPAPSAPRSQSPKPVMPAQPPLPEPLDPHLGFNIANAEGHLRQFMSNDAPATRIPDAIKIVGPDGFPYVRGRLSLEVQEGPRQGGDASDPLRSNLVQSLLQEGFGLALWRDGEKEPVWVYKYRDILCLKLFDSLRPPPEFDETLYADTLDKPLPVGSQIVTGYPSEAIYPPYAKRVLHERVAHATGQDIGLDLRVMQIPDVDTLRRIKLNIKHLDTATQKAISAQAHWCLPYVSYL